VPGAAADRRDTETSTDLAVPSGARASRKLAASRAAERETGALVRGLKGPEGSPCEGGLGVSTPAQLKEETMKRTMMSLVISGLLAGGVAYAEPSSGSTSGNGTASGSDVGSTGLTGSDRDKSGSSTVAGSGDHGAFGAGASGSGGTTGSGDTGTTTGSHAGKHKGSTLGGSGGTSGSSTTK